jgi:hypothetical protein
MYDGFGVCSVLTDRCFARSSAYINFKVCSASHRYSDAWAKIMAWEKEGVWLSLSRQLAATLHVSCCPIIPNNHFNNNGARCSPPYFSHACSLFTFSLSISLSLRARYKSLITTKEIVKTARTRTKQKYHNHMHSCSSGSQSERVSTTTTARHYYKRWKPLTT